MTMIRRNTTKLTIDRSIDLGRGWEYATSLMPVMTRATLVRIRLCMSQKEAAIRSECAESHLHATLLTARKGHEKDTSPPWSLVKQSP